MLKTSSQEGTDTINELKEDVKEGSPEDPHKQMDKGKSSPVITAEKLVTLHKTVGNQNVTTTLQLQGLHATDKSMSRTVTLTLHNK
jgi:hypothetical protein